VGKMIAISYVANLVSQEFFIFYVLDHGSETVRVGHKIVCQVTSPLTIILSSSEFFVMPKVPITLPYCDEHVIIIVTTSTRSYPESLHGAWEPHSEFLKSFSLIVQSFHYCPSRHVLAKNIIIHFLRGEGVIFHYHARRTNTCCTMTTSQDIRKKAQSGRAMRLEPQDLALINEDPNVRASFE
jgi:hypothetical protein